jgi:hypothetical protein
MQLSGVWEILVAFRYGECSRCGGPKGFAGKCYGCFPREVPGWKSQPKKGLRGLSSKEILLGSSVKDIVESGLYRDPKKSSMTTKS